MSVTERHRRGIEGVRVAVTRPLVQGVADGTEVQDPLAVELDAAGVVVVSRPLVAIVEPLDREPLQSAAGAWRSYDWLVFTSGNAVRFFARAVREAGSDTSGVIGAPRVAAVGPATAAAVEAELGLPVAVVPEFFTGDELAAAMATVAPVRGATVLWPRALEAREALPRDLVAAGARLDAPVAYRTVPLRDAAAALAQLMADGGVDVVTLTSPSAVRCLAAEGPPPTGVIIAAIGTSTAEAAIDAGLPVHVVPVHQTIPGLVAALVEHLRAEPPE